MGGRLPRVFVSYSHDSDAHRAAVLALAQQLRRAGVDAWIDQFEPNPEHGWATWMRDQIDRADHVLIVPTETYQRRFYGRERPDVGKGVRWEGLILTDRLYHRRSGRPAIRAILVGEADARFIPDVLGTHTFFGGAEDFLAHLRGEVGALPEPLEERAVAAWVSERAAAPARAELERFLEERFTGSELDRALAWEGLDDARRALPKSDVVGLSVYVTAFVDHTVRKGVLARGGIWRWLREIQPNFVETLDELQAQWG